MTARDEPGRGHFGVEHSTFQLEPAGHAEHEGPIRE
jgi:hypothetical protein